MTLKKNRNIVTISFCIVISLNLVSNYVNNPRAGLAYFIFKVVKTEMVLGFSKLCLI